MTPPSTSTPKRGGTREKMLISAAQVMRERGAAGVTIDSVLARSGAPRGSVYYHFPDGRNQILIEALRYAGDSITAVIDKAADKAPGPCCANSSGCGSTCLPTGALPPAAPWWQPPSAPPTMKSS